MVSRDIHAPCTPEGRPIIATVAAYSAVRAPVPEMIIEGSEATMGAISSLRKSEVWLDELAPKLALDKSVTNRRLRRCNERDYLVSPEARRGQLARIFPAIQCRKR